jgi:predicted nuclease with TOPRIM domain
MKYTKLSMLLVVAVSIAALSGCGVPKDKYEALLNEKIALEEKVTVLTTSKDALKKEYDNLLNEKMELATKAETLTNEKAALKGEYDKILDEKIALKAAYDKLLADNKDLQDKQAKPVSQ